MTVIFARKLIKQRLLDTLHFVSLLEEAIFVHRQFDWYFVVQRKNVVSRTGKVIFKLIETSWYTSLRFATRRGDFWKLCRTLNIFYCIYVVKVRKCPFERNKVKSKKNYSIRDSLVEMTTKLNFAIPLRENLLELTA